MLINYMISKVARDSCFSLTKTALKKVFVRKMCSCCCYASATRISMSQRCTRPCFLHSLTSSSLAISYLSHLEPSHKKHPHPPWPQANQVGREASSTSQATPATSPHKTESPPAASWPPGNRSEASPRLVRRGKQSYKVVIIRARERERGLVGGGNLGLDRFPAMHRRLHLGPANFLQLDGNIKKSK